MAHPKCPIRNLEYNTRGSGTLNAAVMSIRTICKTSDTKWNHVIKPWCDVMGGAKSFEARSTKRKWDFSKWPSLVQLQQYPTERLKGTFPFSCNWIQQRLVIDTIKLALIETQVEKGKHSSKLGRGGGQVVSMLTFNSYNPSLIPAEVYHFYVNNCCRNEWK